MQNTTKYILHCCYMTAMALLKEKFTLVNKNISYIIVFRVFTPNWWIQVTNKVSKVFNRVFIFFRTKKLFPVQIDGEPWMQAPATVRLSFCNFPQIIPLAYFWYSMTDFTCSTLVASNKKNSIQLISSARRRIGGIAVKYICMDCVYI